MDMTYFKKSSAEERQLYWMLLRHPINDTNSPGAMPLQARIGGATKYIQDCMQFQPELVAALAVKIKLGIG